MKLFVVFTAFLALTQGQGQGKAGAQAAAQRPGQPSSNQAPGQGFNSQVPAQIFSQTLGQVVSSLGAQTFNVQPQHVLGQLGQALNQFGGFNDKEGPHGQVGNGEDLSFIQWCSNSWAQKRNCVSAAKSADAAAASLQANTRPAAPVVIVNGTIVSYDGINSPSTAGQNLTVSDTVLAAAMRGDGFKYLPAGSQFGERLVLLRRVLYTPAPSTIANTRVQLNLPFGPQLSTLLVVAPVTISD